MKETASVPVRLYPSSRKKLKILAAKSGASIAEMVHRLLFAEKLKR